jgi:hypothetical protein
MVFDSNTIIADLDHHGDKGRGVSQLTVPGQRSARDAERVGQRKILVVVPSLKRLSLAVSLQFRSANNAIFAL